MHLEFLYDLIFLIDLIYHTVLFGSTEGVAIYRRPGSKLNFGAISSWALTQVYRILLSERLENVSETSQ